MSHLFSNCLVETAQGSIKYVMEKFIAIIIDIDIRKVDILIEYFSSSDRRIVKKYSQAIKITLSIQVVNANFWISLNIISYQ